MSSESNITDQVFQNRYEQELQARDQITNKLQASIGIYFVFATAGIYMLRMVDFETTNCVILTLFYVGISTWVVLLIIAGYYTGTSISGFEYRVLPKSELILGYRNTLFEQQQEITQYNATYGTKIQTKEPYSATDTITIKWLTKCADFNYQINETRRIGFTKSVGFLIYSCLPFIFSSILFVFCDMDASSPKKEDSNQGIAIAKEVKNLTMQIEKFHTSVSQPPAGTSK